MKVEPFEFSYATDTGKSRSAAVRDLVESGLMELLGCEYDAAERDGSARRAHHDTVR